VDTSIVAADVAGRMPALIDDLKQLVAIPSVAFPGFPAEPVERMGAAVVDLFRRSGASDARLLDIPGGYPAVYAEIPGPAGSRWRSGSGSTQAVERGWRARSGPPTVWEAAGLTNPPFGQERPGNGRRPVGGFRRISGHVDR